MKKLTLTTFIFLFAATCALAKQPSTFGLGIQAGNPTGLSGKLWTSKTNAYAFLYAWNTLGDTYIHLHADYLWHDFKQILVDEGRMPVYYGIGGWVESGNKTQVGVRVPVGLEYIFPSNKVDIFMEIAPGIRLVEGTAFTIQVGIGGRYYFSPVK